MRIEPPSHLVASPTMFLRTKGPSDAKAELFFAKKIKIARDKIITSLLMTFIVEIVYYILDRHGKLARFCISLSLADCGFADRVDFGSSWIIFTFLCRKPNRF